MPREYGFALMARLYPKVDAFKVLEKTQGIYKIHSAAGFLCGIICFLIGIPYLHIAIWTFSITLIFYLLRLFGVFIIPGMVVIPTIYSRFTGFGLITIALLAVGLWRVGIAGTIAYFVARYAAEGITIIIDRNVGIRLGIGMGMPAASARAGAMYLSPARDFMNAYKLYALKFGVSIDTEPTEEELRKENWIHVWGDFVDKWPQIARRYQDED